MTTRIIESVRVAAAPEALWREIGGFGAVGKWHPLLARVDCEGERSGCRRTAEGQDGSRQVERLLEASPQRGAVSGNPTATLTRQASAGTLGWCALHATTFFITPTAKRARRRSVELPTLS